MTRWENTSVYRALGTLSALPVRALSRLPLKAGKRRCGLSFSQWFLLLGMGAMLCVPHGAWNNLYDVLFALAAHIDYRFGCAARKNAPRNVGDLGPAALGFLLMTVLCTLWAGNKAGNLRVALFFWTGFLLAYLTAAQFRTRTERRTAAAALYITLLGVSLYGLWNYITGAEASDVPIDGEMYRRLGATLEHGINCGEFLAMALPVALVWARTAPTKARRSARTVPLLLPCAAILLTYARSGWILLALALVLLLWYKKKILLLPAAALGIGLAMDLTAQPGSFLHAAVYGFGALSMGRERRGRRVGAALLWCVPLLLLSLPLDAEQGLILLYEGLCATLLFLVLPNRLFGGKRLAAEKPEADAAETEEAERSTARRRLSATALALRELYDSLMRTPKAEDENPAMIFARAAERVCRGCSLRTICWERDYAKTYNALNDATPALLTQGRGRGGDFPSYFTDRCIRFPSFLSAVNSELSAFLLRRQYRGRLADTRAQAAGQYAQLSELLSGAAETLEAQPTAAETLLTYRVGAALRPKEGENVSGDSVTHFETEGGRLCLLLSDGMGCGEEARRESALAVRLLERFLRAGVETSGALKTLNSALTLRAEVSESFTTIDLLTLSLRDGAAEVYKYGAAPSYVKRGARVRRITGSCLPAGLQSADTRPETTGFTLEKGSFFVMLSDGVADVNDDGWLMALLEKFQGDDPQALASAILAAGRERRGGDDDCAVLALYRDKDGGAVEV